MKSPEKSHDRAPAFESCDFHPVRYAEPKAQSMQLRKEHATADDLQSQAGKIRRQTGHCRNQVRKPLDRYKPPDCADHLLVVALCHRPGRKIFLRQTIGYYMELPGDYTDGKALRFYCQGALTDQDIRQKLAH